MVSLSELLFSVTASLKSLSVLGLPDLDTAHTPTLASSHGETIATAADDESFVDVLFETNPLDAACDTRIRLSAQPLETTFDAVCMKLFHLIDFMLQRVILSDDEILCY